MSQSHQLLPEKKAAFQLDKSDPKLNTVLQYVRKGQFEKAHTKVLQYSKDKSIECAEEYATLVNTVVLDEYKPDLSVRARKMPAKWQKMLGALKKFNDFISLPNANLDTALRIIEDAFKSFDPNEFYNVQFYYENSALLATTYNKLTKFFVVEDSALMNKMPEMTKADCILSLRAVKIQMRLSLNREAILICYNNVFKLNYQVEDLTQATKALTSLLLFQLPQETRNEFLYYRALTYYEAKEMTKASQDIARILATDPTNDPALLLKKNINGTATTAEVLEFKLTCTLGHVQAYLSFHMLTKILQGLREAELFYSRDKMPRGQFKEVSKVFLPQIIKEIESYLEKKFFNQKDSASILFEFLEIFHKFNIILEDPDITLFCEKVKTRMDTVNGLHLDDKQFTSFLAVLQNDKTPLDKLLMGLSKTLQHPSSESIKDLTVQSSEFKKTTAAMIECIQTRIINPLYQEITQGPFHKSNFDAVCKNALIAMECLLKLPLTDETRLLQYYYATVFAVVSRQSTAALKYATLGLAHSTQKKDKAHFYQMRIILHEEQKEWQKAKEDLIAYSELEFSDIDFSEYDYLKSVSLKLKLTKKEKKEVKLSPDETKRFENLKKSLNDFNQYFDHSSIILKSHLESLREAALDLTPQEMVNFQFVNPEHKELLKKSYQNIQKHCLDDKAEFRKEKEDFSEDDLQILLLGAELQGILGVDLTQSYQAFERTYQISQLIEDYENSCFALTRMIPYTIAKKAKAHLFYLRAMNYLKQHEEHKFYNDILIALTLDPENAEALALRKSVVNVSKSPPKTPQEHIRHYINQGLMFLNAKAYGQAIACFNKLKAYVELPEMQDGNLLRDFLNVELAINDVYKALLPEINIGENAQHLSDLNDIFKIVVQAQGKRLTVFYMLASSMASQLKKPTKTLANLNLALETVSHDPFEIDKILAIRAEHYIEQGQYAEAEADAKSILKHNPVHIDAIKILSKLSNAMKAAELKHTEKKVEVDSVIFMQFAATEKQLLDKITRLKNIKQNIDTTAKKMLDEKYFADPIKAMATLKKDVLDKFINQFTTTMAELTAEFIQLQGDAKDKYHTSNFDTIDLEIIALKEFKVATYQASVIQGLAVLQAKVDLINEFERKIKSINQEIEVFRDSGDTNVFEQKKTALRKLEHTIEAADLALPIKNSLKSNIQLSLQKIASLKKKDSRAENKKRKKKSFLQKNSSVEIMVIDEAPPALEEKIKPLPQEKITAYQDLLKKYNEQLAHAHALIAKIVECKIQVPSDKDLPGDLPDELHTLRSQIEKAIDEVKKTFTSARRDYKKLWNAGAVNLEKLDANMHQKNLQKITRELEENFKKYHEQIAKITTIIEATLPEEPLSSEKEIPSLVSPEKLVTELPLPAEEKYPVVKKSPSMEVKSFPKEEKSGYLTDKKITEVDALFVLNLAKMFPKMKVYGSMPSKSREEKMPANDCDILLLCDEKDIYKVRRQLKDLGFTEEKHVKRFGNKNTLCSVSSKRLPDSNLKLELTLGRAEGPHRYNTPKICPLSSAVLKPTFASENKWHASPSSTKFIDKFDFLALDTEDENYADFEAFFAEGERQGRFFAYPYNDDRHQGYYHIILKYVEKLLTQGLITEERLMEVVTVKSLANPLINLSSYGQVLLDMPEIFKQKMQESIKSQLDCYYEVHKILSKRKEKINSPLVKPYLEGLIGAILASLKCIESLIPQFQEKALNILYKLYEKIPYPDNVREMRRQIYYVTSIIDQPEWSEQAIIAGAITYAPALRSDKPAVTDIYPKPVYEYVNIAQYFGCSTYLDDEKHYLALLSQPIYRKTQGFYAGFVPIKEEEIYRLEQTRDFSNYYIFVNAPDLQVELVPIVTARPS